DGKIATRTGESRWITGLESRRYAHKLREESDGVMVGAGTVQKDDPSLTARDADDNLLPRQPLRIVVDSHGRIPPASKLLTDSGKTLVALSDADESVLRRLLDSGVEVQRFLGPRGLVDLDELMGYLGKRGVMSLIAEGGGILLGAMFDARLVDKVIAQMAPAILGGRLAPTPVQGDGISRMEDALRLKQVEVHQLGDDVTIVGYCG
ncbi:MAG: riboflavin biosynthesis protein RibD, partial [SAR202 cluster bacterium]|nr:riboflavin biosynthesis protein RibD [SAR202 cluster bacterium]